MNILIRILLIPLGYFAAVLTAATVAALVEWLRAYGPVAHDPAAVGITSLLVLTDWIILFLVLGTAAAVPSLLAIGAAEAFALRGVLYFCGAGLAVAFLTSILVDPAAIPPFMAEPTIAAAAGLAGGVMYWLIAGRGSGLFTAEPKPR